MMKPVGNWYEIEWVEYQKKGSLFLVDYSTRIARLATIVATPLDQPLQGMRIGDAIYVIQSQVVDIDDRLFCRAESIICEDRS